MSIEHLIEFPGKIHVADIGASPVAGPPPYQTLLERGVARLSAIDGDERQREAMIRAYGPETRVITDVIADGKPHKMYLALPESGMSSILKPSERHLAFLTASRFSVASSVCRKSKRSVWPISMTCKE